MTTSHQAAFVNAPSPAPRGRPRSITFERIADAGIEIGLPAITFTGVAAALGVSHMALYKHVPNLDALKRLVAEEIFRRWESPPVCGRHPHELPVYLGQFVASLRALVKAHPGLAPYLLRRSSTTRSMLAKIDQHHRDAARAFGLNQPQARWLLATIAFHCIALADTVYSIESGNAEDDAGLEHEFNQGMHALIVGALACINSGGMASSARLSKLRSPTRRTGRCN